MDIENAKPNASEGQDETKTAGGDDAAQNDADQKVDQTEPESGTESNSDRGTEDSEAGEGAGENEGAEGEEAPAENVDEVATLRDQVAALQAKIEAAEAIKANQAPVETKPVELTEEQWLKKEEELGMSRHAIKWQTNQIIAAVKTIMSEVDKRFSRIDKADTLREFSRNPKFSDAPKYQKEMDEFLTQFDPSLHSNPKLLESAYWVAKGKNAAKMVTNVRREGERNRKVVGAGKPAAPNGGGKSNKPVNLSGYQKHVAERFGGEGAYRDMQKLKGKAFDA